MSSQESTTPNIGDDQQDSLDRAAAQGPLPESINDDAPGGGEEEHVEDSTDQEANASILGIHLRR